MKLNTPSSLSGNVGLQSLLREPERLEREAGRLNSELETLVLDNYKVFVESLTCSLHLQNEEKKLEDTWKQLSSHVADMSKDCSSFREHVQTYINNHKRNRKTLQHHMQVLDLLEVPQLVDACIRTDLLEEALELALFVNNLERRHLLAQEVKHAEARKGVDVIRDIVNEVHGLLSGLQQQMLLQLAESNSMPKLIQIVNTLRKMDTLFIDRLLSLDRHQQTEGALKSQSSGEIRSTYLISCELKHRMDFLEARTVFLLRQLNNSTISSGALGGEGAQGSLGAYGRVMEILEVKRTHLFNIISQFNHLFAEHSVEEKEAQGVEEYLRFCNQTILQAYLMQQIDVLCSELQSSLENIEDGNIFRNVYDLSLYLASRLSQQAADCKYMMLHCFEQMITKKVANRFTALHGTMQQILSTEKISDPAQGMKEQIIPLVSMQDHRSYHQSASSSRPSASLSSEELSSPKALLTFPPLAYLLNQLLAIFNFLAPLPITSLYPVLRDLIATQLGGFAQTLLENKHSIDKLAEKYYLSGANTAKSGAGIQYAEYFSFLLVPHVFVCFAGMGDQTLLQHYQNYLQRRKAASSQFIASSVEDLQVLFSPPGGTAFVDLIEETKRLWRRLVEAKLLSDKVLVLKQMVYTAPAAPIAAAKIEHSAEGGENETGENEGEGEKTEAQDTANDQEKIRQQDLVSKVD